MSTVTDAASGTQFARSIAEINEIRSRDPGGSSGCSRPAANASCSGRTASS